MSVLMCSLLAFYLFIQLLEHVYDKHCLKRAFWAVTLLTAAYTALVLWNLGSGVLFYFDMQGNYHRGILNSAGYMVMVIEMAVSYTHLDVYKRQAGNGSGRDAPGRVLCGMECFYSVP